MSSRAAGVLLVHAALGFFSFPVSIEKEVNRGKR
ncbi:hypothetical protein ES708_18598 [subsurface metagenome]